MDELTFWLGVLASLFGAAIWAILPRCRWLSKRCIEAAVRRMPREKRKQLREEWTADLYERPNDIFGFFWAIDLLRGAEVIAGELRKRQENPWIDPLLALGSKSHCYFENDVLVIEKKLPRDYNVEIIDDYFPGQIDWEINPLLDPKLLKVHVPKGIQVDFRRIDADD